MGEGEYAGSLHIKSIRLMETSQNFEKVISAMTALDILISDVLLPSTYKHGKIISSLFNHILNDELDQKFNPYIIETFKLFAANKQKIYIDLCELDRYNKQDDGTLVNLIVNELKAFGYFDEYSECEMNMGNINILKPQLFDIFKNVNYLEIHTDIYKGYLFSLTEFLSVIEDTTVNEVWIKGGFMKQLWQSSSAIFIETYAKKNFDISYPGGSNSGKIWIKRN